MFANCRDVMERPAVAPLIVKVQHYLEEVLGIPAAEQRVWKGADELTYFLRDAFEFSELDFLSGTVLLAMASNAAHSPVGEIRSRLDKVRAIAPRSGPWEPERLRRPRALLE